MKIADVFTNSLSLNKWFHLKEAVELPHGTLNVKSRSVLLNEKISLPKYPLKNNRSLSDKRQFSFAVRS